MQLRKPKSNFIAVFLQKDKDGYFEISSTTINDIGKESFSYKGHTFQLKLENEVYKRKDGKIILFYDFIKGDMITLKIAKSLMNTDEMDDFVEKNIFGQLARALRESLGGTKGYLIPIVIGLIFGIAIGYFIGMNYSPTKTVIEYLNQTVPIVH